MMSKTMFNRDNLIYAAYICLAVVVIGAFMFGRPKTENVNSSESHIEIIRPLNSPDGEYDYYIKNPKFKFLDIEGNVKVMDVSGFYVKIGSPVEITCKVKSIDR